MKETTVREKLEIELNNPVLLEGLPGLGMVGKIAVQYLIRELKAQKFAEMYSPHFPYYVLVNRKGNVRLLRASFYFWKNQEGANDLMLLTGDSQAQTIEGQYEVANGILDFAVRKGVKMIVTIGGYREESDGAPKVMAVSTAPKLLEKALQANAIPSVAGNPIVGTAGLLLGLAKFRNIEAICLLGETRGYLPDPKSAKSILEVSQKLLNFQIDMKGLEAQIEKSKEIVARMQEIEEKREKYSQKMRQAEEGRISYIS
jgi:hypothetical protein